MASGDEERAVAALRAGDFESAFGMFTSLVRAGGDDATLFMGLAVAAHKLARHGDALDAVDRVIAAGPRNSAALLLKADILQATGRRREAAAFYQASLATAPTELPHGSRAANELARARRMCETFAADYEAALHDALAADPALAEEPRYRRTIDILFGKARVYHQEPGSFYFPGLPQIQFYERADFDWCAALEERTDEIAREAAALLDDGDAWRPYLVAGKDTSVLRDSPLVDNPDWSAIYLLDQGRAKEAADRCPATMAALADVPLCGIENKTPNVLFSRLRPGTHIEPHNGLFNFRLICHLPLIVPGQCSLRVGNETRSWTTGELTIFDDSIEHEARNDSDRDRIVLLFDIWRPEISDRDRRFLNAVFRRIDTFI